MATQQTPDAGADDAGDAFHDDLTQDTWEYEVAAPSLLTRFIAEFLGTYVLVLMVVSAAMFSAGGGIQMLAVGLAFGFTTVAAMVAIGGTSGAHINPAVTVGHWLAGRFPGKDVAPYIIAQTVAGIAAAGTMYALLATNAQIPDPRQVMNAAVVGYGDLSPAQFPLAAGLVVEVIAAALLTAIVLSATSLRARPSLAPVSVGLALVVLVMWTFPFTNASLNPARATGAALFGDTAALGQLWVWWLAAMLGAAVVGLLYRAFGPEEDFEVVALIDEETDTD